MVLAMRIGTLFDKVPTSSSNQHKVIYEDDDHEGIHGRSLNLLMLTT